MYGRRAISMSVTEYATILSLKAEAALAEEGDFIDEAGEFVNQLWANEGYGPIFVVVAGLILLYLLYRILKAVSYLFSHGDGSKTKNEKKQLREAHKTLKKGDFANAGRLFQAGGEYELAADAYMKGGRYILAGEAYLSRGKYLEAARAFDAGGVFEKAADLYQKSNRFDLASEAFLKTGRKEAVARMWERAGDLGKAALMFEDLEKLDRAAECWEKLNEPAKAGRLLHT